MTKWNITVKNILGSKKLKLKKMKTKIFNFLSRIATACKI